MQKLKIIPGAWHAFNRFFDLMAPLGDLFIRIWIARIFFMAGQTKIQNWDATIALFTMEYQVPLLSPTLAALLGTSVELMMPILLFVGLGGRLPAFILFIFNIIAVISYPYLLTSAGAVGLNDHLYWGILLMLITLHGTGKLSLDTLITRLIHKNQK